MELKVRGILLDIYIAIDKVWHDGLIFKLHQNGVCSDMKGVVINGQCSSLVDIWAGVPQRSICILSAKRFDVPLTNF